MFRDMDEAEIAGLAESIKEHGLMHPLVVRPCGEGYQIISGRQRLRAARLVGLSEVPCIVVDADDTKAEMMLIDANVQTRHLTAMEVARAVRRKKILAGIASGRHTTIQSSAQCAEEMGMSERQFRKLDSLNDLIEPLQDLIDRGRLGVTAGEKLSKLPKSVQEEVYAVLGEAIADISGDEAKKLREENERGHLLLSLLNDELQKTQERLRELEETHGDKAALEERIRELRRKKAELEYDVIDRQAGMRAAEEREKKQGVALYNLLQTVAREVQAVRPEIEILLQGGVSVSLAPYVRAWGEMFSDLGTRLLDSTKDKVPARAPREAAR
jgi:ParB/RepB/Spo0J family partition protein